MSDLSTVSAVRELLSELAGGKTKECSRRDPNMAYYMIREVKFNLIIRDTAHPVFGVTND